MPTTPPPYQKFCRLTPSSPYSSGTGVVFYGLSQSWPEYPFRQPGRVGSSMQMMAGWDGDKPVPGRLVRQDYGAHESNSEFEVSIPLLTESQLLALLALYGNGNTLLEFTHDYTMDWDDPSPTTGSYTNLWLVCWNPSANALQIESLAGFPGKFRARLKFGVVSKLA